MEFHANEGLATWRKYGDEEEDEKSYDDNNQSKYQEKLVVSTKASKS